MRPFDRFEQSVAGAIDPRPIGAVVDGEFAVENVGEERDFVEMPAGFAAGRNRNDRCGDVRDALGIGDGLPDNRLVAGKDRRQQGFILARRGRRYRGGVLGRSRRNRQGETEKSARAGRPQIQHAELHNAMNEAPIAQLKDRRSG